MQRNNSAVKILLSSIATGQETKLDYAGLDQELLDYFFQRGKIRLCKHRHKTITLANIILLSQEKVEKT